MHDNALTIERLADGILDIMPEFLRKCGKIPCTRSSMLPSEIMAFCAACRVAGIEKVVESGRSFGYSTECILKMGFDLISFDESPQHASDERIRSLYPHADLRIGSCPPVLSTRPKFGLILDGPKGHKALSVVDASNPDVAAIHDCCLKAPVRPEIDRRQWVTTDLLNPCEELDAEHLLARGLDRSVLSEAFVLAIAWFPMLK